VERYALNAEMLEPIGLIADDLGQHPLGLLLSPKELDHLLTSSTLRATKQPSAAGCLRSPIGGSSTSVGATGRRRAAFASLEESSASGGLVDPGK
jgi:hypothetical protein